jgi:hypothetical protein
MGDEWRVEVALGEEGHGLTLGERLRSLDLDDEARERLGRRVVVTRDGSHLFLYARSEEAAKEAERVARELVAAEGLGGRVSLTRWHPVEEAWKDASKPLPTTQEELAEERGRREAAEEAAGEEEWEVRVDLPSLHETLELAGRLADEGLHVRRRWKYLLVGASSETHATELAARIGAEAPEGAHLHVEPGGEVPHPVFVFMGAHTPGIARDLGL